MGRTGVLDIMVTGDLVLDAPDAGHWLSGIAPALRRADLAIGHLEVPHTDRWKELEGDVPAHPYAVMGVASKRRWRISLSLEETVAIPRD